MSRLRSESKMQLVEEYETGEWCLGRRGCLEVDDEHAKVRDQGRNQSGLPSTNEKRDAKIAWGAIPNIRRRWELETLTANRMYGRTHSLMNLPSRRHEARPVRKIIFAGRLIHLQNQSVQHSLHTSLPIATKAQRSFSIKALRPTQKKASSLEPVKLVGIVAAATAADSYIPRLPIIDLELHRESQLSLHRL